MSWDIPGPLYRGARLFGDMAFDNCFGTQYQWPGNGGQPQRRERVVLVFMLVRPLGKTSYHYDS